MPFSIARFVALPLIMAEPGEETSEAQQYATYDYSKAEQQLTNVVQHQIAPAQPVSAQQEGAINSAGQAAPSEQDAYAQYYAQYYQQYYSQAAAEAEAEKQPATYQAPAAVYKAPASYAYEKRGAWEKLFDESSGHIYYRNTITLTSQWKAPADWTGEAVKKVRFVAFSILFLFVSFLLSISGKIALFLE